MKAPVELPKPVLDLLSVHGPVRLSTSDGHSVSAHLAPIHLALCAIVPASSVVIPDIVRTGRAEFIADNREKDYLVRVKLRVAPGRPLPSEPRRSELQHWAPDGVNPVHLVVLHLYPTFLEFTRTVDGERQRVMGDIPGAALPNPAVVWWELAFRRLWIWLPVPLVADWTWLLFQREEDFARWLMLGFSAAAVVLLVGACGLLADWSAYVRWREGVGERAVGRIAEGWAGVDEVRTGAMIAAAGGVGAALLVGVVGGLELTAWVLLSSGAPVLAAVYGLRHLFRRSDAIEGARP